MSRIHSRITDRLHDETMAEKSKKLLIVGDAGCGKTSLLSVFSKSQLLENSASYVPTIYDSDAFVHVEVVLDRSYLKIGPCLRLGSLKDFVKVELNLWDTGGQEDLDRFRSLFYPDADVVLVCFAIDDRLSFRNVSEKWIPEVRHFCGKVPVVLVATKNDLRNSLGDSKQQTVDHEEIGKMAKSIRAVAHFETSAKTGQQVMEIFDAATRAALGEKKTKSKGKLFSLSIL